MRVCFVFVFDSLCRRSRYASSAPPRSWRKSYRVLQLRLRPALRQRSLTWARSKSDGISCLFLQSGSHWVAFRRTWGRCPSTFVGFVPYIISWSKCVVYFLQRRIFCLLTSPTAAGGAVAPNAGRGGKRCSGSGGSSRRGRARWVGFIGALMWVDGSLPVGVLRLLTYLSQARACSGTRRRSEHCTHRVI